jgi:hypothetical protein
LRHLSHDLRLIIVYLQPIWKLAIKHLESYSGSKRDQYT